MKLRCTSILVAIIIALCWLHATYAVTTNVASKVFRVGLINTPPYSYFIDGKPTGLSYDIWNLIATRNKWQCEYIDSGHNIDDAVRKVASGELDVTLGYIALSSERELKGFFSLPYFRGYFVLLAAKQHINFIDKVYKIVSAIPSYIYIIIMCTYLLYLILFYVFEHKRNPELVDLKYSRALELLLWRNLLAGIKHPPFFPETRVVRTISVIWSLIVATIFFSMLAGATSSFISGWMDSEKTIIHLSDLDNKVIDVVGGIYAIETAQNIGLNVGMRYLEITDENIERAIQRIKNNDSMAVFLSKTKAVDYVRRHKRDDLYISQVQLPSYLLAYFVNNKLEHMLRKINYSILKIDESGEKMFLCKKYLGFIGEQLCL